jgi:hypothetical protein
MWGALIGAGVNLASGLIGYSQQQKEIDRQKQEAARLAREAEEAAKKARAGIQDYGVGRGARQAYMMSQEDRAGDVAQQKIDQATGASLGALKAGGPRALMAAPGLAFQSAQQSAEQAAQSQARRMAGQKAYGVQEQEALDANIARANEMAMFDYGRAVSQGDTERGLGRSLTQDQALNQMALTQDVGSAASSAFGMLGQMGQMGEKGMKVKETPGEFSHRTNPIDLVRNGTKIGEATGGELIFNPEQSGKLETLATEGSTELHKYLRGLFKKFNKKS